MCIYDCSPEMFVVKEFVSDIMNDAEDISVVKAGKIMRNKLLNSEPAALVVVIDYDSVSI